MAGAVHLGRLEDLTRQPTQVIAEQKDLEGQAVSGVGQPDRDDRAGQSELHEQVEHGDQRHLDGHHHQADDDDEKQVLARELHPGKGVRAHAGHRELGEAGRERLGDLSDARPHEARF